MKTQHATTAEWKIQTCQENGIFLDSFYITAEDNPWDDLERIICRFPTGTGQYGEPGRINLANARLIAAAPELRELVLQAYDRFTDNDFMPPNDKLSLWLEKAESLFAKVGGY